MKLEHRTRTMDLADAVLAGLGTIVGGGVFVALGLAAEAAGPALLVSLVLAGAVALLNGQAAAALTADAPQDGVYGAAHRLVHPIAGHLAGWLLIGGAIAATAAIAATFAAHVVPPPQVSMMSGPSPTASAASTAARVLAAGTVVALCALSIAGIRLSLRTTGWMAAGTLTALAFLAGLAVPLASRANFKPFAPHGFGGVWAAAALMTFLFAGTGRLSAHPRELSDPRRTAPRAAMLAILLATVLYLVVGAASVGLAGPLFSAHNLANRPYNAPLLIVASLTNMPGIARAIVTLGAFIATVSILLSILETAGRTAVAMARAGDLPPFLGALLPGPNVPWIALVVTGVLAAILAAAGTVAGLLSTAAFALLAYHAVVSACAAMHVREVFPRVQHGLAVVACVALALALPRGAIVAGSAVLAAGVIAYPLRSLWKS